MTNNEQRNWQQHLTNETESRERTNRPQDKRPHYHWIKPSENNDNLFNSSMMLNQQQISRRLGEMSLRSYKSRHSQLMDPPTIPSQLMDPPTIPSQLMDPPTIPSQLDINAQLSSQQALTDIIPSFSRESQEQLEGQQQIELSLKRKLNDLRKIHNELNLPLELRKEEEEELLSQYPKINKKTKWVEADSSSLTTDTPLHQIDRTYDDNTSLQETTKQKQPAHHKRPQQTELSRTDRTNETSQPNKGLTFIQQDKNNIYGSQPRGRIKGARGTKGAIKAKYTNNQEKPISNTDNLDSKIKELTDTIRLPQENETSQPNKGLTFIQQDKNNIYGSQPRGRIKGARGSNSSKAT